jgi:hypothetical protein
MVFGQCGVWSSVPWVVSRLPAGLVGLWFFVVGRLLCGMEKRSPSSVRYLVPDKFVRQKPGAQTKFLPVGSGWVSFILD